MKKRTKRILGFLALTTAAAGAAGTLLLRRKRMKKNNETNQEKQSVWARPNMPVTFRAELMPGRSREERTYRVKELLSSGRVTLKDFSGEHAEQEFEPRS